MRQKIDFCPREKQVVDLLVQGKSNKEMSVELGISVRTIEFHLSNIYKKLDVSTRIEAALLLTETTVGESTGVELREPTVTDSDETSDNGDRTIMKRRFRMKYVITVVVTLLVVIGGFLIITNMPIMNDEVLPTDNLEQTELLEDNEVLPTDDLEQTEVPLIVEPDQTETPLTIDYEKVGGRSIMEGVLVDGDDPNFELVNKDMQMGLIREFLGQPELELIFDSYRMMPNALIESISRETGVITSVFKSDSFTYYVEIESGVISLIQPNQSETFQEEIPENSAKDMEELREIAYDFAGASSFMFLVLEDDLYFEEGCKSNSCTFWWANTNTWEGIEWRMNSVYIEIVVLIDGEIISYINTLDLVQP